MGVDEGGRDLKSIIIIQGVSNVFSMALNLIINYSDYETLTKCIKESPVPNNMCM